MRVTNPSSQYFASQISSQTADRFGRKKDGILQKAEIEAGGTTINVRKGDRTTNWKPVGYDAILDFEGEFGNNDGEVSTDEFQDYLEQQPSLLITHDGETYLFRSGEFVPHFFTRLVQEALDNGSLDVTETEARVISTAARTSGGVSQFLTSLKDDHRVSFHAFNQVLLVLKDSLLTGNRFDEAVKIQTEKLYASISVREDYFFFMDNANLRFEWDSFLGELNENEQEKVRSAAVDFINEGVETGGIDPANLYVYYLMLTRSSDYFLEQAIVGDYASELAGEVNSILAGEVTTDSIAGHLDEIGGRLSRRSNELLLRRLGIPGGVVEERYAGSRLESSLRRTSALWERSSRGFEEAFVACANIKLQYQRLEREKAGEDKLSSAVKKFYQLKAGLRRKMQPVWQQIPFLADEYYGFARDCLPQIDSSVTFRISSDEVIPEAQATLVDQALKTNFARTEQRIVGSHAYKFDVDEALQDRSLMSCIELCLTFFTGLYGVDLSRVPTSQQDPDQMNGLEVAAFLRREDGRPLYDFVLSEPVRRGNDWLGYVSKDAVEDFNFISSPVEEGGKTLAITSGLSSLTDGLSRAAFVGLAEHYDLVYEDDFGRGHYGWGGGHSFILTYAEGVWTVMEANYPKRGTGFQIHEFTNVQDLEAFFSAYDRFRFLPLVQNGNTAQLFNDLLVENLSVQRPGRIKLAQR